MTTPQNYPATVEGHQIEMDLDGMLTVTPAVYGPDVQRICGAYPHIDEAQRRRRAKAEADRAAARADLARRRRDANTRVAQCTGHAPRTSSTVGWTECVLDYHQQFGHAGASHGGVPHVETCRCGAERKIETNGRHSDAGHWHPPVIQ